MIMMIMNNASSAREIDQRKKVSEVDEDDDIRWRELA